MANHASTRTTQLYDRRREELRAGRVPGSAAVIAVATIWLVRSTVKAARMTKVDDDIESVLLGGQRHEYFPPADDPRTWLPPLTDDHRRGRVIVSICNDWFR
jgi:hypothetical protein